MTTLIYTAISITFLFLALGLFRKTRSHEPDESLLEVRPTPSPANGRWLHLSERIFDPSDARWVASDLAFPKLADALIQGRKLLALRWLEVLQASFDEVVRTPELFPSEAPEASSLGSWQMLWLTLRFKFVISYALLVVKLFGPYHRLIPSFSWVPFAQGSERSFRRTVMANGRNSH
jgi:hypothetical protein